MKITVDLGRCQGYANCVAAAPDVFDVDDATGKAVLLAAEGDAAEIREAARSCPVAAIGMEE
ncbi:ferredoxin [Thermomonospora echinospora]|uniref:Ferredoxin n=1 Tax=Thermomonospora echinospora TaxID=1992 RepID=A0A1H6E2Y4_9ACTN|nr:ferredoxin [Thermomonospora echinospora]SEG91917.1 ferredoxin [Thermomonospora echinospora]